MATTVVNHLVDGISSFLTRIRYRSACTIRKDISSTFLSSMRNRQPTCRGKFGLIDVMKPVTCLVLIAVIMSLGGDFALADENLTYSELIASREQLNHKQVTVSGYFDADNVDLAAARGSPLEPVAIDLSKGQMRELKRKGIFHSGYVRIVGRFEYAGPSKATGTIGSGPERRIVISRPAGFRNAYSYQISKIKKFEPIQSGELRGKSKEHHEMDGARPHR